MSYYSRIANYGNYDDSAYNDDGTYNDDGAYQHDSTYYPTTGYPDYPGDHNKDTGADTYHPNTHANYNSALSQYAAEHRLTTHELQELEDECLRDQAAFEQEYQEEMEDRQEVRGEVGRTIERIERTEEQEYKHQEGLADKTRTGTSFPMYNHEQGAPGDQAGNQPHTRYTDHLISRAAEYDMMPEALHALNKECIQEQSNWTDYEDEELLGDWAEDQAKVLTCIHMRTTHHEPKHDVYEAYGTADELPNPAMPLECDGWPNLDTLPLEHEHEPHPPSWEYTTDIDPGYDDETSTHGVAHTAYHAVEPHFDNAEPFRPGNSSLWDEIQAVDGEWTADYEGEADLYEGAYIGMCNYTTYSPPPPPISWNPPQPPTTSHAPSTSTTLPWIYPLPPLSRSTDSARHVTDVSTDRHMPPNRAASATAHPDKRSATYTANTDPHHARPVSTRTRYQPPHHHLRIQTPCPPSNDTLPLLRNPPRKPNVSTQTTSIRLPDWTSPGSWRDHPPHLHTPRPVRSRSDSPTWQGGLAPADLLRSKMTSPPP